jgi:hypothetical protein
MTQFAGRLIGISLSNAPDRAKLGFPEREINRATLTIAMTLVRAGAEILYAGDLRANGFTFQIFRHIARAYAAAGSAPFVHVIPSPVLQRTPWTSLRDMLAERRGIAKTFIALRGQLMGLRLGEEGLLVGDDDDLEEIGSEAYESWWKGLAIGDPQLEYSRTRRALATLEYGRVAMGGKLGILADKEDHYEGAMPGIVEEAMLTLEAGKPLIALGAFGGAARDIAIALDLLDAKERVPRGPQMASFTTAISVASRLRTHIPEALKPRLAALALEDRMEIVAREVRDLLAIWPADSS